MNLQEKIFHCRKKAGLSQEALAEKIGVSRQAISKWETGDAQPELSKLRLLAQTFQVSTDWLLSEEDSEPELPQRESPLPGAERREKENMDWIERIPGTIGCLLRRYGWLFGVYLSLSGAAVVGMGLLVRQMVSRIFGLQFAGFSSGPETEALAAMVRSNPMSAMSTFLLIFGLVLLLGGVILAIVLKRQAGRK